MTLLGNDKAVKRKVRTGPSRMDEEEELVKNPGGEWTNEGVADRPMMVQQVRHSSHAGL